MKTATIVFHTQHLRIGIHEAPPALYFTPVDSVKMAKSYGTTVYGGSSGIGRRGVSRCVFRLTMRMPRSPDAPTVLDSETAA